MNDTPAKFHWLVAGEVVTVNTAKQEKRYSLNALVLTEAPFFTQMSIGQAQKLLQARFVEKCPQVRGAKIVDVFLISINMLGQMTEEQFHAGFEKKTATAPAPTKTVN